MPINLLIMFIFIILGFDYIELFGDETLLCQLQMCGLNKILCQPFNQAYHMHSLSVQSNLHFVLFIRTCYSTNHYFFISSFFWEEGNSKTFKSVVNSLFSILLLIYSMCSTINCFLLCVFIFYFLLNLFCFCLPCRLLLL